MESNLQEFLIPDVCLSIINIYLVIIEGMHTYASASDTVMVVGFQLCGFNYL